MWLLRCILERTGRVRRYMHRLEESEVSTCAGRDEGSSGGWDRQEADGRAYERDSAAACCPVEAWEEGGGDGVGKTAEACIPSSPTATSATHQLSYGLAPRRGVLGLRRLPRCVDAHLRTILDNPHFLLDKHRSIPPSTPTQAVCACIPVGMTTLMLPELTA